MWCVCVCMCVYVWGGGEWMVGQYLVSGRLMNRGGGQSSSDEGWGVCA